MTKKRITAALCRLQEMLIGSVIISTFVCLLCLLDVLSVGSLQRDLTLALVPLVYILWNVKMLRSCYVLLRRKQRYYLVNLCATVAFMLISVASYLVLPRQLYSWLFLVTYLGGFSHKFAITGKIAILLFFTVMTASVFLAIIKMEWVQEKLEKHERDVASMPPRMEMLPEMESEKKDDENGLPE